MNHTSSAGADALEDMRCDEIEREEHREAREDRQRAEDKAERQQDRENAAESIKASTQTPKCPPRSGRFYTKFTEVSGDCGPRKPFGQTISEQPAAVEAPCTGKIFYSADNCSVHYETSCPEPTLNGISTSTGDVTWSSDGAEATGNETLNIQTAAKGSCTSTYAVTVLHGQ